MVENLEGLLHPTPPSTKQQPSILWAGKKVGAADVARAASHTRKLSEGSQGRLQIQTGCNLSSEYLDSVSCSRQMRALSTIRLLNTMNKGHTYDLPRNLVVADIRCH